MLPAQLNTAMMICYWRLTNANDDKRSSSIHDAEPHDVEDDTVEEDGEGEGKDNAPQAHQGQKDGAGGHDEHQHCDGNNCKDGHLYVAPECGLHFIVEQLIAAIQHAHFAERGKEIHVESTQSDSHSFLCIVRFIKCVLMKAQGLVLQCIPIS